MDPGTYEAYEHHVDAARLPFFAGIVVVLLGLVADVLVGFEAIPELAFGIVLIVSVLVALAWREVAPVARAVEHEPEWSF